MTARVPDSDRLPSRGAARLVVQLFVYATGAVLALNASGVVATGAYGRYRDVFGVLFLAFTLATPLFALLGRRTGKPWHFLLSYVLVGALLFAGIALLKDVR